MNNKSNNHVKEIPIYGVIDERTREVVYKGDSYTGRFMQFALLLDVVIRGFLPGNSFINSNWDLMLIVIIGGLISTAYQIKYKVIVLSRPLSRTFITSILFLISVAAIAFLVAFIFSK
jgi:hypothetical protein